jgi:dienelactone hydrolase
VDAVRGAGQVPILLTRVGRERAEVTATVEAFTAAAAAHHVGLEVIDVPDGQHGFDILDHTDGSRAAVIQAMEWVTATLRQ